MTAATGHDEESPLAVDATADRIASLVLAYGVLGIAAYRGFVEQRQSWELLGLAIVAGGLASLYRISRGGLTTGPATALAATTLAAVAAAAVIALLVR